jgi:hypothetical protein
MESFPIIGYIAVFTPLFPIIAGVYKIKTISFELKILLTYIVFAFVTSVLFLWFIKGYKIQVGFWHISILVEYLFIMWIIIAWQESKKMARFFGGLFWIYLVFWLCAKFTFEPLDGFYSYTSSSSQAILALSAGYTLFIVIGNGMESLLGNQRFWILLTFVVNYLSTLMPLALVGVLSKDSIESTSTLWSINWIMTIITNILLTIGFLCPTTRQSS